MSTLRNIEQAVLEFESPLYYNKSSPISMLKYMVMNSVSGSIYEERSMNCMKYLFLAMIKSQGVFDYVVALPPISHAYAKFPDAFPVLIAKYAKPSQGILCHSRKKQSLSLELQEIYQKQILPKIELYMKEKVEKLHQQLYVEELGTPYLVQDSSNVLRGVYRPYLIGKTTQNALLKKI